MIWHPNNPLPPQSFRGTNLKSNSRVSAPKPLEAFTRTSRYTYVSLPVGLKGALSQLGKISQSDAIEAAVRIRHKLKKQVETYPFISLHAFCDPLQPIMIFAIHISEIANQVRRLQPRLFGWAIRFNTVDPCKRDPQHRWPRPRRFCRVYAIGGCQLL